MRLHVIIGSVTVRICHRRRRRQVYRQVNYKQRTGISIKRAKTGRNYYYHMS